MQELIKRHQLLLVLVAALLLRLVNINESLWLDEAISVTTVQNFTFLEIVTNFIFADVHPPLYYLVLDLWGTIFGFSEVAMRLMSVLFGVATVYLVYLIGQKITSPRVAILAAIFLALNPLHVYYSQEARMYSLAAFLVTLGVYGFITGKRFLFVLSLAAAFYTDYLPLLILPVFLVLAKNKISFTLTNLLPILLLFSPWLPVLFRQLQVGSEFAKSSPEWAKVVGEGSLKNILLVGIKFIFGRISFVNKLFYGLISGLTGVFYASLIFRGRHSLLVSWLLIPIVLSVVLSLFVPILSFHRLLFVIPAFCLLLANGSVKTRLASFIVILVSLGSLLYFWLTPSFHREDWRQAVTSYMNEDDALILMPNLAQASPIYYYREIIPVADRITYVPADFQTVYLIRYVQEIFDPTDSLRISLEQAGYRKIEERAFQGVLVWKYSR